jgi:hypothetical protein
MRLRLGKYVLVHEQPGVISENYLWVFFDECWMYTHDHLPGLFWEIITGWRKDRNLVG